MPAGALRRRWKKNSIFAPLINMKTALKLAQLFSVIVLSFGFSACCKVYHISAYKYENASGHDLRVTLYLGGKVQEQYGFDLPNSGSISPFGDKNRGSGSPDALWKESDSTIVRFDDGKIATHYNSYERSDPSSSIPLKGKNPNAVLPPNRRSLYDGFDFRKGQVLEKSRCSEVVERIYTFTEQDYLDAKK